MNSDIGSGIKFSTVASKNRHIPRSVRRVVGVEFEHKSSFLPDVDASSPSPEQFKVPGDFASRIFEYFRFFYVENPYLVRNCHIGAAAMTGARVELSWVSTYGRATEAVEGGVILNNPDELKVGQWGVIGEVLKDGPLEFYSGEDEDEGYGEGQICWEAQPGPGPEPHHSLVGLEKGLAIQTESMGGPFIIAPVDYTLNHYRISLDRGSSRLYIHGPKVN